MNKRGVLLCQFKREKSRKPECKVDYEMRRGNEELKDYLIHHIM